MKWPGGRMVGCYSAGAAMAILDYATRRQSRLGHLRWAVAALVGGVIGFSIGIASFEPVLRTLAGGRQIAVFDVDEPFQTQARFLGTLALCGAVVGCCAVGAARSAGWRSVAVWGLGLAACFTVAGGAALFYLRSRWAPGRGTPRIGMSPELSLASALLLIPLLAGVVAVVIVLALVALLRARAAQVAQ